MTLYLHNTRTRSKELFEPITPGQVKMYVCGPTVYNWVHIGNARPAVVFDTLFRVLKSLYTDVVYARNITDIDDKIIKAARENNEPISELTARFAIDYRDDMAALNNLPPTIEPYATHHVQEMVDMVAKLLEQGHAYAAEGHVLFDVRSMADYGQLSNRSLADMLEGARVEVAPYKKYAGDFVLWKPSTADEPGWESPWGRGRPGWHIECSAMVERHLGHTIDIHGGGRDLVFPHHENERAQSQCAHGGEEYVRFWMHNGYVNINGEKMSKSLGNFKTVRGLLEQYPGEVIRFALLSAQYRSELDFSSQLLDQSKSSLDGFYSALRRVKDVPVAEFDLTASKAYGALLDDLNTPLAISELHQLVHKINKADCDLNKPLMTQLKSELLQVGGLMGLLQTDADVWFQGEAASSGLDVAQIEAAIVARHDAKLAKDYAGADAIREQLKAQGVVLEDSRAGTTWRFEQAD